MKRFLASWITLALLATPVWGLGEEQMGNDPVIGPNYASPAGILPVINDPHRVYRWWVNGNEKFFYRGDTIALNGALEAFAKIDSDKLEIVLRPGPGSTTNFAGDKTISYNWHLHWIGGIVSGMSLEHLGSNVWPPHPMMYIYVGDEIQLSDLEIPENVTVLELADLKKRYVDALQSTDRTVRGWTCGELAGLDKYNTATMTVIARMLQDEETWVRLNAASALTVYGSKATAVIDQLEAAAETDDPKLKQRISDSLAKIAAAQADPDREDRHTQMLMAIATYCDERK